MLLLLYLVAGLLAKTLHAEGHRSPETADTHGTHAVLSFPPFFLSLSIFVDLTLFLSFIPQVHVVGLCSEQVDILNPERHVLGGRETIRTI